MLRVLASPDHGIHWTGKAVLPIAVQHEGVEKKAASCNSADQLYSLETLGNWPHTGLEDNVQMER